MSRKARATLPTLDDTSVELTSTPTALPTDIPARWRALFGSEPPRAAGFIELALAWKEQVLAEGDVAPAIQRDLDVAARQAREARQASAPPAADPDAEAANAASCSILPGEAGSSAAPCISLHEKRTAAPAGRPAAPRSRSRAAPTPLPPASSQLLPGTRLVKTHGGRTHVVEVTGTGFLYEGASFSSLSAVAKHITGTHWNGLLFFGLRRRKTYPAKAARHG